MKSKSLRLLVLSDVLLSDNSKPEDEKWFPPQIKFIQFVENLFNCFFAFFGMKRRIRWSIKILMWFDIKSKQNFNGMIKAIKKDYFDGVIGTGNYTVGIKESGMLEKKCIELAEDFKIAVHQSFSKYFVDFFTCWAPGGHDVGYRYDVRKNVGIGIGSEKGGITYESIKIFENKFNDIFGERDFDSFKIVWVCSSLMRVDNESVLILQQAKREQYFFFREALENCSFSKKIVVLIHDPKSFDKAPEMLGIMHRNHAKIGAILHGHSHAEIIAQITRFFCPSYNNLCKDFNVFPVAAPGGMFGIGKGFGVLTLKECGYISFKNVKL